MRGRGKKRWSHNVVSIHGLTTTTTTKFALAAKQFGRTGKRRPTVHTETTRESDPSRFAYLPVPTQSEDRGGGGPRPPRLKPPGESVTDEVRNWQGFEIGATTNGDLRSREVQCGGSFGAARSDNATHRETHAQTRARHALACIRCARPQQPEGCHEPRQVAPPSNRRLTREERE